MRPVTSRTLWWLEITGVHLQLLEALYLKVKVYKCSKDRMNQLVMFMFVALRPRWCSRQMTVPRWEPTRCPRGDSHQVMKAEINSLGDQNRTLMSRFCVSSGYSVAPSSHQLTTGFCLLVGNFAINLFPGKFPKWSLSASFLFWTQVWSHNLS